MNRFFCYVKPCCCLRYSQKGTTLEKQMEFFKSKILLLAIMLFWLGIFWIIPTNKCYAYVDAYSGLPYGFNTAYDYAMQSYYNMYDLKQINQTCPQCIDPFKFKRDLGLTGLDATANALKILGWESNLPPTLDMLNMFNSGNQFLGQQTYPDSWSSTFPGSGNDMFSPSPNFSLNDPTFFSLFGYNASSSFNFGTQFLMNFGNIMNPNPTIFGSGVYAPSNMSHKSLKSFMSKVQSADTLESRYFNVSKQQINAYYTNNDLSNLRAESNTKLLLAIYTDPEYLYWSYRLKYFTDVLYEYIDNFIYNELLNKSVNFKYLSDLIASWKPSKNKQTLKNRFVTRLIFQSYNILLQQQVQAYFDTYEDEKLAFAQVGNFLSQRLQQSWESNSMSNWASKWENRFKSTHDNSAGFKSVLQTFEQLLSDYPAFGEYLSLNKDVVDLSLEFKDYSEVKYVTQLTKDVLSNPDVSKKIAEYYNDYVNQIYNILYSSNVFAEMERYYETLADKLNENTIYQQLKNGNSIVLEYLQYVQKTIHDYLYSCNLKESCIEIARDELLFGDEFEVKESIEVIGKFYELYNSFNYYFYNSAEYLYMVFTKGDVTDIVEAVFNAPMAAIQLKNP